MGDGRAVDSKRLLERQESGIVVEVERKDESGEKKKKKVFKGIEKMTKSELASEFKRRKMKIKAKQTVAEMRDRLRSETGSQRRINFQ